MICLVWHRIWSINILVMQMRTKVIEVFSKTPLPGIEPGSFNESQMFYQFGNREIPLAEASRNGVISPCHIHPLQKVTRPRVNHFQIHQAPQFDVLRV